MSADVINLRSLIGPPLTHKHTHIHSDVHLTPGFISRRSLPGDLLLKILSFNFAFGTFKSRRSGDGASADPDLLRHRLRSLSIGIDGRRSELTSATAEGLGSSL
ncbi:hypothetical protein EVAR_39343_1 [Eumeta japonica]|uniref:Uncharacterized protein n=1 Tax=Eumeta variegata TaxID=151549 RepID=A0A4C1WRP4_EUMVA|nr:hypothetical protein EVAR_39343_1 [Eumeta japonica]